MRFLVTGGAGFIGSAVIRYLMTTTDTVVMNIDKLTYAGNLDSLLPVSNNSRYHFAQVDIVDAAALQQLFLEFQPDAVMQRLNLMSIVPSMVPLNLFKLILSEPIPCLKQHAAIGKD